MGAPTLTNSPITQPDPRPYASAAPAYLAAGWPAVLPVPPESKTPPPAGYSGQAGADTPAAVVEQWRTELGHYSVALRLPDGVIGIDVDDYPKGLTVKTGAATLAKLEAEWGPLPATWTSTARGAGSPSRIRFYRCPPGRYRTALKPDIEIIQRHHRYAVVAPSWHHEVGAAYVWYGVEGSPANIVPQLRWLAELPERWVQGLQEGAVEAGVAAASPDAGWRMLAALSSDLREPCADMHRAGAKALDVLKASDPGSRHDSTAPRVHHVIMLGAHGHPGAGGLIIQLREIWDQLTATENRGAEFERMLLTSARKAVSAVGPGPVRGDPCVLTLGGAVGGAGGGSGASPNGNGHVGVVSPPGVGIVNGSNPPAEQWPRALPVSTGHTNSGAPGGLLPLTLTPTAPYMSGVVLPGTAGGNGTTRASAPPSGWSGSYPANGGPVLVPTYQAPDPTTQPATALPVYQGTGTAALPAPPETPPDSGGATLVEPPTFNLVAEIGAGIFDPPAWLDQPLADAVLERMGPVLRYATDAGVWLERRADRWQQRKDLAGWATGFLARFLPAGDPGADKGSLEQRQAARRGRMLSTPGRNAVASAMRDVVRGGGHPMSLELAELDTDPEILWAGGVPWDLRASQEAPVPAALDIRTPHLHSAACLPVVGPTPLWSAFLSQVWPDPELRAWAVRVLAIALTGYADAAMPVLHGNADMGKTAVVDLVLSVMGTYGIAANPKLLNHGDNSHDTIVYELKGARLAFIDEGPRSGHLAQERLKQLTGGSRLTGRRINQDGVVFTPTHTLVLTSNDEPTLTDAALRKRVRAIPCEGDREGIRAARAAIGDLHREPWLAERPAVLASLIAEAGRWLADRGSGRTESAPASLRERLEILAAEQDPCREWLDDDTEPYEPGTSSSDLYAGFVAWWRRTGRSAGSLPSTTRWGRELNRLGYERWEQRVGSRTQKYRALRLRGTGPGGGWALPHGPLPVPSPPTPGPLPVQPAESPVATSTTPEAATTGNLPTSNFQVLNAVSTQDQLLPLHPATQGVVEGHPETAETPRSTTEPVPLVSCVSSSSSNREVGKTPTTHVNVGAPIGIAEKAATVETVATQDQLASAEQQADKPPTAAETRKATKRAEREAARRVALEQAQGPLVELPAVLWRQSQSVTEIGVAEAMALVRAEVAQWGKLTVDVETTGYPVGHPAYALRLVQLGSPARVVVFDPDQVTHQEAVRELVAEAPWLEAHSAPADLVPLDVAGLIDRDSAWDRMLDTVIPAKLADPHLCGPDPSLKALAPAVLGPAALSPAADAARDVAFKVGGWLTDVDPNTPPERSGWAQIAKTSRTMVWYAGSDVLDTAAAGALLPQPPPDLMQRERAVQRAVVPIAHDGLRLDAARVAELRAEHRAERDRLTELIRDTYGIANPGSPAQVASALASAGAALPLTEGGRPSAAKGALEPLRGSEGLPGRLATDVLDWRHHATALSLFLEPWTLLASYNPADPRVRSTVYTLSADTGRMSCVRFNLQQLSRQGGIRSCITALPGYVLISADFSGVEIRTMAALSQDSNLRAILRQGADIHAMVAGQVFGPEWTKADRYRVKPGIFGWAYGGGIPTLATQIGVSQPVMQAIVDQFASMAPEYVEWADQLKRGVRQGHTVFSAYSGRPIYFERKQPHKAPNYAVQGTAREFLVDALINWSRTKWGGGIVVPVHDEVLAMVPEHEAEEALQTLVECMRTELYGVPIDVESSKPSFHWADAS